MNASTRRGAIGSVLGVGIWLGLDPRLALAHNAIPLPQQAQLLTRRIEHSLGDGVWLRVNRSWEVEFAHQAHGIAITGRQVAVEVDAPQSLAPLSAIEEGRSTADMWPIVLNDSGLIIAAGNEVRESDLAAAIEIAQQMVSERPIPAAEREAQRQHLANMQKAGSSLLDRLPDDLFYPVVGPMHAVRPVALPGGMTGEFELFYSARAVPGKGWLDKAERTVTTRLAGTERIAREYWFLQEA